MEIVWTELLSNSLRSAGDISTDILTAFLNIVFPIEKSVNTSLKEVLYERTQGYAPKQYTIRRFRFPLLLLFIYIIIYFIFIFCYLLEKGQI